MYVSPEAKKNAAKLMTNLRSASNTPKYHHEAHPSDSVSSSQTVDDTLESHACHKSSDKESSLLNERGIDSGCESIIDNNFNYFEYLLTHKVFLAQMLQDFDYNIRNYLKSNC
ncbi:MAG: hypothetical protein MHMPM18_002543 [Marteilia pararefringens]